MAWRTRRTLCSCVFDRNTGRTSRRTATPRDFGERSVEPRAARATKDRHTLYRADHIIFSFRGSFLNPRMSCINSFRRMYRTRVAQAKVMMNSLEVDAVEMCCSPRPRMMHCAAGRDILRPDAHG